MANTSISNLTPGASVGPADLFPDVQTPGIGPVKVSASQIKDFCSNTPTLINPLIQNTVTIGQTSSVQGSIVLCNTTIFPTTVKSSNAATASWALTLPVDAGISAQALLTDGLGNTYWGNQTISSIVGGAASQLLYQSAPNTTAFLANGVAGRFLQSNGAAAPSWGLVNISSASQVTGTLPIASGGTNLTTVGPAGTSIVSNGAVLSYGYPTFAANITGGTANNLLIQIAPNATGFFATGTTGQTLHTGAGGTLSWAKVDISDSTQVTGTVPIATGGTGLTTIGANGSVLISNGTSLSYGTPNANRAVTIAGGAASQLLYQSAANTTAFLPNGTSGQFLQSNGAAAPTWASYVAPTTIFHINQATSATLPAILAANSITDTAANQYFITNTGSTSIVISATTINNYAAYPVYSTATTVNISAGGSAAFTSITPGSVYSLDNLNPITGATSVSFSASSTLTAASTVDRYGTILITVTNTAQTITVPTPTNSNVAGRVVNIVNSGANAFILNLPALSPTTVNMPTGSAATLVWNNNRWTTTLAGSGGQAYLIKASQWGGALTVANALSNAGVPAANGNTYTFLNDQSTGTSSLAATLANATSITNTSIYNGTVLSFPAGQSTTLTQNSSTDYTYISSSSQSGCYVSTYVNSQGTVPVGFDTLLNIVALTDPLGWVNSTTHAIIIKVPGYYHIDLNIAAVNTSIGLGTNWGNAQLRVNNATRLLVYASIGANISGSPYPNASAGSTIIYLNYLDSVTATFYTQGDPANVSTGQQFPVITLHRLS